MAVDPYADAVSAVARSGSCTASIRSPSCWRPLPAMVLLVFVRDAATPLAFLALCVR